MKYLIRCSFQHKIELKWKKQQQKLLNVLGSELVNQHLHIHILDYSIFI